VVRGKPVFLDDDETLLTNPAMVVEVLSRGTRASDLSFKQIAYQAVPSLREYWFVEPESCMIPRGRRQTSGGWLVEQITDCAEVVPDVLEIGHIALKDIYDGVTPCQIE
jgi:Uma2 family endonuclease